MALSISVIVCAHTEVGDLPSCVQAVLAQTRPPDQFLVIDNASTDGTGDAVGSIPRVRVVRESRRGLVLAREAGRRAATGDLLVYTDADCRPPIWWLARVERRFLANPALLALSGTHRYYDWDVCGRLLLRAYDLTLAPATQLLVKHALGIGTVFYGGNTRSGARRSRPSAASTRASSSTARTPTSDGGSSHAAGSTCARSAGSTPRRAGSGRWARAPCSGSTSGTSWPS